MKGKNNTTRPIAYGGMLIALFIAVNFITAINVRTLQTIINIFRILCISLYVYRFGLKYGVCMLISIVYVAFILLSADTVIIYIVPCVIEGLVYGSVWRHWGGKLIFIIGIFLRIGGEVYRICAYEVMLGIDLLSIYADTFKDTLELNAHIVEKFGGEVFKLLPVLIIMSIIFESFCTSVCLFMSMRKILLITKDDNNGRQ